MDEIGTSKFALITGASSGIGLAFCHLLADNGYNLVINSRSEKELKVVARDLEIKYKIIVKILPLDLSNPESAESLYKNLTEENLDIEILINNAGFGASGYFNDLSLDLQTAMLNVNLITLTKLTHLFLQDMLKKNKGKILNVASTAGYLPGPLMAVYYASKAYVLHFSQAVHSELKGKNVTVTALCPGPTSTHFRTRASLDESRLFKYLKVMEPDAVAQIGLEAMNKGKSIIIPGIMNKIGMFIIKFLPKNFISNILKEMHRNSR